VDCHFFAHLSVPLAHSHFSCFLPPLLPPLSALQAVEATTTPSILALTRQNLPNLEGSSVEKVALGGYPLQPYNGTPDLILVATGSEVSLAVETAAALEGCNVAVVSMPCCELFDKQGDEYKQEVSRSRWVGGREARRSLWRRERQTLSFGDTHTHTHTHTVTP